MSATKLSELLYIKKLIPWQILLKTMETLYFCLFKTKKDG